MTTSAAEYLETYLQDHRAGAEMGSDLAHRLAEENSGTPYADFLAGLALEIDADVALLEDIMERFDVGKPRVKMASAKIAERAGRLKPNEQFSDYSPLSRVLEIEALRGGVEGKLSLWDGLAELAPHDDRLHRGAVADALARAERQLDGLREHHRMAAREAFVGPG